ncbi:MAG: MFS transporter [Lautropia sp.]
MRDGAQAPACRAAPREDDWPCPPGLAVLGLAAACLGTAPGSMDTSVNAAFPALTRDFDLSIGQIRWIVIPWVVAQITLTLAFGRLGDLRGHKPVFMAGMVAAALTHVACAVAPDFASLSLLRFVQGIAVGLGLACAPAIATLLFPPRLQPRVLSLYVAAFGAGAAIGPLAGGVLIDAWGWPAVFLFRAPLALCALALIAAVPVPRRTADPHPTSLMRTIADAMRLPGFARLQGLWIAANLGVFSILLLGPYLLGARAALQVAGGDPAGGPVPSFDRLGALLSLNPAGALAAGLAGAAFASHLAPIALVRAGLAIAAASLVATGLASSRDGDLGLGLAFFFAGAGLGLTQVGYMTLTLSRLPVSARGVAGALVNVTRLAGVIGGALLLFALDRAFTDPASPLDGHARTFVVTGLALALVAIGSIGRGGPPGEEGHRTGR